MEALLGLLLLSFVLYGLERIMQAFKAVFRALEPMFRVLFDLAIFVLMAWAGIAILNSMLG